jgi:HEAT repeat protein
LTYLFFTGEYEQTPEWLDWIGALAVFRDARVTEFFLQVVASFDDPSTVFAAMRYLAACGSPLPPHRLVPLLLQNDCPVRARAVATLLDPSPNRQIEALVRIGLLSDHGVPPPLNDVTASAWRRELRSPFRNEAIAELEDQGEPAWTTLAGCWSDLDDDNRLWMLDWGLREFRDQLPKLIREALASHSKEVATAALRILSEYGEVKWDPTLRDFVREVLGSEDGALRRAVAALGPPGVDWRAFLATESDASVRRVCLIQLRKSEQEGSIPDLIRELSHPDWQTRAVCANELAKLGEPVIEAVKPLLCHTNEYVRVAAASVLRRLDQATQ